MCFLVPAGPPLSLAVSWNATTSVVLAAWQPPASQLQRGNITQYAVQSRLLSNDETLETACGAANQLPFISTATDGLFYQSAPGTFSLTTNRYAIRVAGMNSAGTGVATECIEIGTSSSAASRDGSSSTSSVIGAVAGAAVAVLVCICVVFVVMRVLRMRTGQSRLAQLVSSARG